MRFFCFNLGCQHVRGEIYLSTGLLDAVLATGECTSCPICTRSYHKDFLPVFWSSVIEFIEWMTATSKLPFKIENKIQVSSYLMMSPYWKEMIFDKASGSVSRSNINALLLSLTATGVLDIEHTIDGCMWIVGREAPLVQHSHSRITLVEAMIGIAKNTKDDYWVGIQQHPLTRIRVRSPEIPLVS